MLMVRVYMVALENFEQYLDLTGKLDYACLISNYYVDI